MIFNDQQQEAINSIVGPVMVISCAGSGKTTVILERVKKIIDSGVDSKKILVTTFSKAAAEEMGTRFSKKYLNNNIKFCTIHSICYSILSQTYNLNSSAILKSSEKKHFFYDMFIELQKKYDKDILGRYKDFDDYYKHIELILSGYMSKIYREKIECIDEVIDDDFLKDIYISYKKFKNKNGKLDYDDMIIEAHKCLMVNEGVANYWKNEYEYIIIDEFQDTSVLQSEIFYILAENTRNICVVGDDDQSIYSFRDVDDEIFKYFLKEYPEAKKIYMETNYRSCQKIVSLSEKLIRNNKKRFMKKFRINKKELGNVETIVVGSDVEQTEAVIREIKKSLESGKDYNEIAILYRLKKEAVSICNRLQLENIPFYTKEIPENIHSGMVYSDIKAYYRLANDIGDVSDLRRIINRPTRYISSSSISKGVLNKTLLLQECIKNVSDGERRENIKKQIDKLFFDLEKMNNLKPHDLMLYLRDEVKYRDGLIDFANFIKMDTSSFITHFDELLAESEKFETMDDWNAYIEECKNTLFKKLQENKRNGVFLTTFHGAKGLEWNTVFIISANDGTTPLVRDNEIENPEEERRLFYVAMTRAVEELRIFCCENEEAGFSLSTTRYFKEIFSD